MELSLKKVENWFGTVGLILWSRGVRRADLRNFRGRADRHARQAAAKKLPKLAQGSDHRALDPGDEQNRLKVSALRASDIGAIVVTNV